jgi:hypothetical protein
MFTEFVLTPDVFAASDDVLRDRLKELREVLLPRGGSLRKCVICQLGSEKWQTAVGGKIAAIGSPEIRSDAMKLFEKIVDEVCVFRPLSKADAPMSESDWISSANASSEQAKIDGIVVSNPGLANKQCSTVEDFCSDEFWNPYSNPRSIKRNLVEQEPLLRTICLHSDWLLIRLPSVTGDNNDEVITLKQVLRLATKRLQGRSKCSIRIHVAQRPKRKGGDEKLKKDVEEQIDEYRTQLERLDVRIVPSKSILERMIFAGEWAPMSKEQRTERVRWLLTMTHVAIGNRDETSTDPSTWILFDRKSAYTRWKQIEESLLPNE